MVARAGELPDRPAKCARRENMRIAPKGVKSRNGQVGPQGDRGRFRWSWRRRIDLLWFAVQEYRIAIAVGNGGVHLHRVGGDPQAILLRGDCGSACESRQNRKLPHRKFLAGVGTRRSAPSFPSTWHDANCIVRPTGLLRVPAAKLMGARPYAYGISQLAFGPRSGQRVSDDR
jgi:hypothetical protein